MVWLLILSVVVGIFLLKRFLLEKLTVSGLSDKHVFISGCDSGFGQLLALKLVENGIPTFAGCLTEKGRADLEKQAKFSRGHLWTVPLDVTNEKSVKDAGEFVKQHLNGKGLWGLVCNAGISTSNVPDDWLDVDDYKKNMEINAYGVIRTCHTFKPFIKKQKGRIVIVTSIVGRVALPATGPYSMSKFAAEAYADVLRLEGIPWGYSVHILEPGFFKTNLLQPEVLTRTYENLFNRLSPEMKQDYGETFFQRGKENILKVPMLCNENVHLVVDAYYHALTSKFPRRRYHVGNDSKFVFIPLSFCPTFLQDLILVIMAKMKKVATPAACSK